MHPRRPRLRRLPQPRRRLLLQKLPQPPLLRPRLLQLRRPPPHLLPLRTSSLLCALASACGPVARAPELPPAPPRIAIVVGEGDARGVRLVAIDEHGDRQLELLQPSATIARDTNPALSPDAGWMVFASSRGRPLDETSLWIARLEPDAIPMPLTDGAAIDAHPTWTPDGSAIVWASTRGGHGFDLWRAPINLGAARPRLGEPRPLTSASGHEVTPAVAADGTILYAAVTELGGGALASRIEERAPDGAIRAITAGPTDSAPALSPDGTRLVFARPVTHGSLVDSELWIVPRAGGEPQLLVDLPLTDESGPVWSRDGRYVFATSVLRGADGRAVFSSVIAIDTREPRPIARLLEDRVGPIARVTPAIALPALDDAALRADPEYLPELARIMAKPMVEHKGAAP